jgi:hypothetical protein
LVVGPEVAAAQFAREKAATPSKVEGATKLSPKDWPAGVVSTPAAASVVRRFLPINRLDPMRMSRDASRIADEIVQHLAGLVDHAVRKRVAKRVDQQIMSQGKS